MRVGASRPRGVAVPANGEWLIVLTDRTDDDPAPACSATSSGTGCAPLTRGRQSGTGSRRPASTRRSLRPGDRDVATGLLAATPPDGWPPAPGGVLTRDHAFGAVAAAHLGLSDPVIDIAAVLGWAADPSLPEQISDLRMLAGNPVTDAVLAWAAERTGAIAPAVLHLLRGGEARDVVPLGLVAGAACRREGQRGGRGRPRWRGTP